ncbi:hypothetical protein [Pantoea sp. B623]|uniref:Nmad2 family putative nucleotide modification protein n=2 Tax=Erwiniaceae TaxID=1903409 RepID=UPI001CF77E0D|nr:hypothetical protein [Pantoea sp. B623]
MTIRMFSYKIVRDYGFAPNPFHGYCTLATCKPQIRKHAKTGDLILGYGSKGMGHNEELIYIMQVDEKITYQQYWDDVRFYKKKPNLYSNKANAFGDNIYHQDEFNNWIQVDSHHSFEDGVLNQDNLERDTSSLNVLISQNFIYFGCDSIPSPTFEGVNENAYPTGRGYRVNFSQPLINNMSHWLLNHPKKGYVGRPISW